MTRLLELAINAATTLTEADQDRVAHVILDEAKRLSIRNGIAEAEAGEFVSHADMTKWLESWGTDEELPPPSCK